MSTVISDEQAKKIIGQNVSSILRQRNLSQAWLANATGEYEATIGRVCKGRNCPSSGLLARIAEALDVSIDALISPRKKLRSAS